MAKKETSSRKKSVSKVAKATTSAPKKSVSKTVAKVAKKPSDTAKVLVSQKSKTSKTTKSKPTGHKTKQASVLDISENAVVKKVSETITQNIKKSEHWHVGLFALVVVLAAYFSFQASNKEENKVVDTPTPIVESPTTQVPVIEVPTVVAAIFPQDYAWLTQIVGEDVSVAPGGTGEFILKLKNTGKATWYRDTKEAFRLGTVDPSDAPFPFLAASMIDVDGKTRPAVGRNRVEMMEKQVAPGATATFKLVAQATDWNKIALKPGSYKFTVGILVEEKGSLSKKPLIWRLNVK